MLEGWKKWVVAAKEGTPKPKPGGMFRPVAARPIERFPSPILFSALHSSLAHQNAH